MVQAIFLPAEVGRIFAYKSLAPIGRARRRRVAEQSGAMEANAGSRNEVSSEGGDAKA